MNLKPEELVKALRFCGKHECITCPRDIDECSQMVYTAAEQIERDQKEIEKLRKELEWKDMVIALAQKKQTEAEAERDALLEYAKLFTGCDTCKHSGHCKTDAVCNDCEQDVKGNCYCKDCERGNNWVWRGLPEAPKEDTP